VVQNFPYAIPAFQASGAANYAASEAVPYPTAVAALAASPSTGGLGWAAATRWFNAATSSASALNVLVMPPNFQVPTTYEWNLQTQYEFLPTWVLEVGYVGSHSIHQLLASIPGGAQEVDQLNVPTLATAGNPVNGIATNTAANAALRVPYLGFATAGLAELGNLGKSLFDSAQVTVRKQLSHGLTMQAAYTWARALDTTDHFLYNNPNIENYGPSSYYRPQRLTISYGWDIPSGHHDGLVGKFVNGWNLSGVTIVQDGQPLTITNTTGGAVYGFSSSNQTSEAEFAPGMGPANIPTSGSVRQRLGGLSAAQGYFNKAAFTTIPTVGAIGGVGGATGWGDSGIGNVLGPGQFNFDATLQKTTRVGGIHEGATLVFRTEFFNVFNHPQFNAPSGSQLDASNAAFGQINSTSVNPRLIQFALKYVF
jgi:hypothetical protein